MKFGKRIRSEADQSFGEHYVDYKGLKHLLKPLVAKGCPSELEDEFRNAILAEIEKVDRFFAGKELELYTEFRTLCEEVSRTHLESRPETCTSLDKLVGALEGTAAGALIRNFLSFSARVDSMRKFIMMNTLAVVKITKKHDKQSSRQLQWEMVATVHKRHFYNSQRFGSLITDIEVLASQIMYRLSKSRPHAESYSCPICLGILCNPVVLSCGHRFCMKCVSAASYFCQTSCPVCRKEQILDMETIKVDSLLSHFLDRYFPEGQSGVKQCKTCAFRQSDDSADTQRRKLPCEECAFQVLESLEEMQEATLDHLKRDPHHTATGTPAQPDAANDANLKSGPGDKGPDSGAQSGAGGSSGSGAGVGVKREAPADKPGMEVRPRLKRRNVGQGGKQALGGRPGETEDAQAAPVILSFAMLRAHFNLPLNDAAKKLGVCATAIKKVCRKMGIKQWPHRKLKAVEKRLALLNAEHRYAKEEGTVQQCRHEIRELEEKRESLLQGIDCDITGVDNSEEAVPLHDPTATTATTAGAGGREGGKGAEEASASDKAAGSASKEKREGGGEGGGEDLMEGLGDLGELESLGGHGKSAEEASEQDVWAMLHRMMSDTPSPLDAEQEHLDDDNLVLDDDARRSHHRRHAPHVQLRGRPFPLGHDGRLIVKEETGRPPLGNPARPPPHPAQPKSGLHLPAHNPYGKPAPPPDLGLGHGLLHHPHGLPKSGAPPGTKQPRNAPGDGAAGGGAGSWSSAEAARELGEARQRVATLEEEVVHLRQFSMALIKERGDLAMQLQHRSHENMELKTYVQQLESDLKIPAHGKRPLRDSDNLKPEGPGSGTEWMGDSDGLLLEHDGAWGGMDHGRGSAADGV